MRCVYFILQQWWHLVVEVALQRWSHIKILRLERGLAAEVHPHHFEAVVALGCRSCLGAVERHQNLVAVEQGLAAVVALSCQSRLAAVEQRQNLAANEQRLAVATRLHHLVTVAALGCLSCLAVVAQHQNLAIVEQGLAAMMALGC